MNLFLVVSLLFCAVHESLSAGASAALTSALAARSPGGVFKQNATCPARTVNYITHSLPQQCLALTARSTDSTVLGNAHDTSATAGPTGTIGASTDSTTDHVWLSATSHLEHSSAVETSLLELSSSLLPSSLPSPTATTVPTSQPDESSPLEGDRFLSFEEWKKQNLQKAGQSEHLGRERVETQRDRKRSINLHTALDALGDDTEIELDFSGFIPDAPDLASATTVRGSGEAHDVQSGPGASNTPGVRARSKDAGTTCKERFNYASFDCAADILKTNAEAKSANAVLGENKDHYMLNVCSADNKFLILKLCDDISIDTIVLANFEFFSSIVRTFRVSVSDRYPVKLDKWETIGTFEARNTREIQAFLVENPTIWARYVRIEFLSHYGTEYYCPVSLIRVHGTTMLEEYKRDAESLLSGEDDDHSEPLETGPLVEVDATSDSLPRTDIEPQRLEETDPTLDGASPATELSTSSTSSAAVSSASHDSTVLAALSTTTALVATLESSSLTSSEVSETCAAFQSERLEQAKDQSMPEDCDTGRPCSVTRSSASQNTSMGRLVSSDHEVNTREPFPTVINATNAQDAPADSTSVFNATRNNSNVTSSARAKATPSSTQSLAAAPTMQESFFKSVQKRLQLLEANSSLSLQYIEDQSRALRDAFNKVEQRQLDKISTFLEFLNTTVLNELRDFRQQYDQLWQSTVIELDMQRERYQQDNAVINARLGLLADELILQKRILLLQMVLILVCLALVLFAKGTLNQYLELPMVQRVLARSPSNRWLNMNTLETPSQSPPVTRQGSLRRRQGILKGHRRVHSEDSTEGALRPDDIYPSPPTPTSITYGEQSDTDHVKEAKLPLADPEFDPSTIERPSTSPPVLPSEISPSASLNGISLIDTMESRIADVGLSGPPPSPEISLDPPLPRLVVEEATPEKNSKHLTWSLPDS